MVNKTEIQTLFRKSMRGSVRLGSILQKAAWAYLHLHSRDSFTPDDLHRTVHCAAGHKDWEGNIVLLPRQTKRNAAALRLLQEMSSRPGTAPDRKGKPLFVRRRLVRIRRCPMYRGVNIRWRARRWHNVLDEIIQSSTW